ncbi:MAG: hypothetical protein JWR74_1237 [Polaromonas sp.]|nr:hypothetical protein [Polaromonas sp.]
MLASTVYIRILRPLVTTTQQQDDRFACHGVVNPIARPYINAKFPHAFATELMVAKVSLLQPIDPPVYRDSGSGVTLLSQPFNIDILLLAG